MSQLHCVIGVKGTGPNAEAQEWALGFWGLGHEP